MAQVCGCQAAMALVQQSGIARDTECAAFREVRGNGARCGTVQLQLDPQLHRKLIVGAGMVEVMDVTAELRRPATGNCFSVL